MATCYSNHMENYLGYAEREKLRDEEAVRVNKARRMLWEDFMDRVYLFMSDLCQLQEGDGLDSLPHGELYFNEKEMRQLASISRLCDPSATPQEILNSLEAVVPNFRFKVEGVWHYPTAEYIDWVRYDKECVPGTLRGIHADALAEILPEEDLREMEERREAEKKAAADKAKAERRKESRERKKAQGENGKSNSEESSECLDVKPANKGKKRKASDSIEER